MKSSTFSKKNKNLLLGILLATSALTGWRMYSLYQQQELWGHLPLFFFTSVWLAVVLVFWKKYTAHPKGLRWLGLSTLSGVLLSLGWPPLPLVFLLFVAWVPLLIVEDEVAKEQAGRFSPLGVGGGKGNPKPKLFPYAYHTFALWNVLTTWWVGNTAFIAGFFAFFLNALFMCVPFLVFHKTKKAIPGLAYVAFATYWMSFELLHLNWEISWSWLNLGNAFGEFPSWVQWYEYTGTFGGTLWILVANILIFKFLQKNGFKSFNKINWKENIGGVIKIAVIILAPITFSLFTYFTQKDKGKEVEVVVVQPNFEPHFEKFTVSPEAQMKRFIELSEGALTDKTEYLVFPETSFNAGEKSRLQLNKQIRRFKDFLKKYPNLKLVTGVSSYKIFRNGEPHTHSTREQKNKDGSSTFWEAYNAAIEISAADSIAFYVKGKLVPGAEILPYNKFFFFLKPLAEKLGGSLQGLGTSKERKTFDSNSGKIAPVICYESVFGDYHAGYVRKGAEAIFIVTNDGWWDKTAGYKQHLAFASLRAIETRRSVARSANLGTCGFINQRGDVLQPTEYGVAGAVRGKIKFNDEITFYVKWGDMIGRLAFFMAVILFLNTVAQVTRTEVRAASRTQVRGAKK
ncbi:MAG TPA: apolipoprotein N-acyltransferase [Bacteroidetes bacterium]|nr:apolipoprotein N-acyltransferase [Bacteroidota bacterium]